MRITLGVTDNAWADFLSEREHITEANFWVPSGRNFMGRASRGEPFLFKTKRPINRIVGGGYYDGFWELRVSEAWTVFGQGNGCASEAELSAAIQTYRTRTGRDADPDPTIGCVLLRNLFFDDAGSGLAQPEHWGGSIVQGKTYDSDDPDYGYVDFAFRALQGSTRVDLAWDTDLVGVDLDDNYPRYGAPVLTRQRLGQGSFRLSVLDAYGHRCAVSGSRTVPVLDAAHVRAYARGGRHVVTNGITLRTDIHKLYDRGYLGIDTDYRLRVSPRLRVEFGNGAEFCEQEERGAVIRLPERPAQLPDRGALDWHMTHVFLSA